MKKAELIFIPVPGPGHIISTVEFAARLIAHDPRISITVLAMKSSIGAHLGDHIQSLVDSQPRITLIDLPQVDPPPSELLASIENYVTVYIESHVPHVMNIVRDLMARSGSDSARIAGLVVDFFCMSMVDVACELALPTYVYLTTNAGFLDLMLNLPGRDSRVGREFLLSDPDWPLPGWINPVPASVLPSASLDGKAGGYATYVKLARRFREARGIMVNTFEELEPYAIRSFSSEGLNENNPRVYPVGPVIDLKGIPDSSLDRVRWEGIWKWLDDQPPSSVIFLCFGSMGSVEAEQAKQIAIGIERSGHKFLWSLRSRSASDDVARSWLPEGFEERTKERGIVCGWAPQVDVLSHVAIGGFLSHCGWNSILESLWNGVPIATWPMYAEQQLNAFRMVKELGLGVEMRLDYRIGGHDMVAAEEVERAIRCLMDAGGAGQVVRKKVKEMREVARNAVREGGSSFNYIGMLIQDLLSCI